MSIQVAPEELAEVVAGLGVAYLLTLGDRPRPHVGAVGTTVTGGVVRVTGVGRTGRGDVAGHEAVTLLWAPREPDGYSLIVDGTATVVDDVVEVVPDRAVLHRPAPAPPSSAAAGTCASDCVEVPVSRS